MNFKSALLSAAIVLSAASTAFAAAVPVAFKDIGDQSLPAYTTPDGSLVPEAGDSMMKKYGAERGMRGYALGSAGELLVLTRTWADARRVYTKMVNAGDVRDYSNRPYYFFKSVTDKPTVNPLAGYKHAGRVDIAEQSYGNLYFVNGTPAIKSFVVLIDRDCVFSRAEVLLVSADQQLAPTELVASYKVAPRGLAYEHSVNGGVGASVAGIQVRMGALGGPVVTDICPVHIYVKH